MSETDVSLEWVPLWHQTWDTGIEELVAALDNHSVPWEIFQLAQTIPWMNYIFAYTGDVLPLLQRGELVARRAPQFHSYLHCAAAYLVHRRGMKALLDRFWPWAPLTNN